MTNPKPSPETTTNSIPDPDEETSRELKEASISQQEARNSQPVTNRNQQEPSRSQQDTARSQEKTSRNQQETIRSQLDTTRSSVSDALSQSQSLSTSSKKMLESAMTNLHRIAGEKAKAKVEVIQEPAPAQHPKPVNELQSSRTSSSSRGGSPKRPKLHTSSSEERIEETKHNTLHSKRPPSFGRPTSS